MQRRTPEQHRTVVDDWRKTAPKDDSEIFHEISKKSRAPRHGSLADQLAPLLQWMRRPEGILPGEEKPEPQTVSTNWSVVPDNDNAPPKGHRVETAIEITPSIEEIERSIDGVKFIYRKEPQMLKGGRHENERKKREVHAYPVSGDYESHNGCVIRLGGLRFSDGTSNERTFKSRGGKIVKTDTPLPVGAMIGCGEKTQAKLGAAEDPMEIRASNEYYAEMLGVKLTPYRAASQKKAKRKARKDGSVSFTKCLPGLPRGSNKVADSFLGMKKTGCAGNGSQAWEDICTAIVNREIWAEAVASLPKKDIEVLEKAMTAGSMTDFAGDKRGGNAYLAGRRILISANDNLGEALKKSA